MYMHLSVAFLIMNFQCMVTNHLKYKSTIISFIKTDHFKLKQFTTI